MYGPPITTRLPRAFARRTTSLNESSCTSIAVAITMSAHSISDVRSFSILRSTNRRSHDAGNKAETVNRPKGGKAHRLPSKGSAWRKLQYVSGNSGLTSRTFIVFLQLYPIVLTTAWSGHDCARGKQNPVGVVAC